MSNDGIAPINGPNTGITFVTPRITATSTDDGILKIRHPKYAITPIISESIILPLMKPPKISFVFLIVSMMILPVFGLQTAYIIFLLCPARVS